MTFFYVGVSLLVLLAVLFITWPLLMARASKKAVGRQQTNIALYQNHLDELEDSFKNGSLDSEQYELLKQELSRNLLEDSQTIQSDHDDEEPKQEKGFSFSRKWLFVFISSITVVSAAFIYAQLGAYDSWRVKTMLDQRTELQRQYLSTRDAALPPKITAINQQLLGYLEASLADEPVQSDLQLRVLYARTLASLRRSDEAILQFQKVLALEPESTQIMLEAAQLIFVKAGNRVIPVIDSLLERVFKYEPNNPVALSLAGVGAFQSQEYVKAIHYWETALKFQDQGTANSQALRSGIETARQHLSSATAEPGSTPDESETSIVVQVSLADQHSFELQDTVFVYARAWQGARMPLAIQRLQVKDLPIEVRLTNAMSMAPGMDLNSADQLEVVARVSKSGSPVVQPGDWQASHGPVELSEQQAVYELLIDTAIQ